MKKDSKDFVVKSSNEISKECVQDIKKLAAEIFMLAIFDEYKKMRNASLAFGALQTALILSIQDLFPEDQWAQIADTLGKSIKRTLEESRKNHDSIQP